MGNVFIMARKEFVDLVSNPYLLLVFVIYVVMAFVYTYDTYLSLSDLSLYGSSPASEFVVPYLFGGLNHILTLYGSIVAIILGFVSITNEKVGNAVNTLLVKPLYRDSVIVGKVLGCIGFFVFLLVITSLFYTSFLLVFCGGVVGAVLWPFLCRLPVVLLFTMLFILVFLSLSMIITIVVKDHSVALLTCIVVLLFAHLFISNITFAAYLSFLFGDNQNAVGRMIAGLSPSIIMGNLAVHGLYDPSVGLVKVCQDGVGEIVKLLLGAFIPLVAGCIVFLRSDV